MKEVIVDNLLTEVDTFTTTSSTLAFLPPGGAAQTLQTKPRSHAASGVLAGQFTFPSTGWGSCDIWGSEAHLWIPVAQALGFVPRILWFDE